MHPVCNNAPKLWKAVSSCLILFDFAHFARIDYRRPTETRYKMLHRQQLVRPNFVRSFAILRNDYAAVTITGFMGRSLTALSSTRTKAVSEGLPMLGEIPHSSIEGTVQPMMMTMGTGRATLSAKDTNLVLLIRMTWKIQNTALASMVRCKGTVFSVQCFLTLSTVSDSWLSQHVDRESYSHTENMEETLRLAREEISRKDEELRRLRASMERIYTRQDDEHPLRPPLISRRTN